MKKKWRIMGGVLAGMLLVIPPAWGQYPAKPITCVVGFEPGGPTDISARAICDPAGKMLGQPIVVTNKAGGTGSVALASVKKEKPDGYTICTIAGGVFISQHMRPLPFDLTQDFTPIIQYGDYSLPVLVTADSPWKTFQELVEFAKANPGKIRYGTSGAGSIYHLAMETLALQEGIKWTHIPFKGCHPANMALLGGHIEVEVCPADFRPFVNSGRLRLLSTFGQARSPSFPDVPTWNELGYKVSVIHMAGFVGPKGLPGPIVERLHGAFKQVLEDSGFRRIMKDLEMPIVYRNPEDLGRAFKELTAYYGKLVKQIGLDKKE
jgi:tripartite-type tricarboxylate transporter receptor subunit TctC